MEIVLYAAFLASYAYGIWCFLSRDHQKAPRRGLNVGLLACNTLMFLLATAVSVADPCNRTIQCMLLNVSLPFPLSTQHLALDARGAMHGFTEGSPLFDAIKFVIYVLETLIGSCFMGRTQCAPRSVPWPCAHLACIQIYRLYRVYSRRWQVIIVPSILLFADGGASAVSLRFPESEPNQAAELASSFFPPPSCRRVLDVLGRGGLLHVRGVLLPRASHRHRLRQ